MFSEFKNQSEETRLCVFGQKCLKVVQFDPGSLDVKVITDTVELDDWLWDVAWLQVRTTCQHYEKYLKMCM